MCEGLTRAAHTRTERSTYARRNIRRMATKKPKLGDRIEHTTVFGVYEGEVVQLLSAQFAYQREDGHVRLCLFNEAWRKVKDE